jgi:hypothetical protein
VYNNDNKSIIIKKEINPIAVWAQVPFLVFFAGCVIS